MGARPALRLRGELLQPAGWSRWCCCWLVPFVLLVLLLVLLPVALLVSLKLLAAPSPLDTLALTFEQSVSLVALTFEQSVSLVLMLVELLVSLALLVLLCAAVCRAARAAHAACAVLLVLMLVELRISMALMALLVMPKSLVLLRLPLVKLLLLRVELVLPCQSCPR